MGRKFNNSFGEDFVYAKQRRQSGKVEREADQLLDNEGEDAGNVAPAIVRCQ